VRGYKEKRGNTGVGKLGEKDYKWHPKGEFKKRSL